jgi:hypothetical protein
VALLGDVEVEFLVELELFLDVLLAAVRVKWAAA